MRISSTKKGHLQEESSLQCACIFSFGPHKRKYTSTGEKIGKKNNYESGGDRLLRTHGYENQSDHQNRKKLQFGQLVSIS